MKPYVLGIIVFWIGWGIAPSISKTPISTPSYRTKVPVAAPTKMRDWRYLVVHHSGAMVGNEDIIEMGHLQRGMENGMAYHFLIGNGSAHLADGQVVEGHRWKYQLHGGHSHQEYLNDKGIGICLVGNFSKRKPTEKQVQALAELVLKLQSGFNIPDDNIHGHGQFYGEDSDCPGSLFPWSNFWTGVNVVYQNQIANTVQHVSNSENPNP